MLTAIGERHDKTAGQVVLRALMQQGAIVIPKTVHRDRMEQNFDVFDFELTEADMAEFASLEDPSVPRIFDHYDPATVTYLLGEFVKRNQLAGGTLY